MAITTYLKGGCANQMFQYAAGLSLARWHNTELLIDNSRYDTAGEWRVYSLDLFAGVNERIVKGPLGGRMIREVSLPYDPQLFATAGSDCWIDGYWQTERYFADHKTELKQKFIPRQPLTSFHVGMRAAILEAGDRSVFVTIRRTDFVTTPFHGVLPFEYYKTAADLIAAKVKDPMFFVFTDEPEWVCPENFPLPYKWALAGNFHRTVKPNLGREDAELHLMGLCRHAILANSSYSWWGCWLGRSDEGGVVIAPRQWFGPTAGADPRDIVPERWIKI